MNYEGNIIRPPSEADSIILQVTVGCSHNRCTFCGAYKDVRFRVKEEHILDADIDFASRYCSRQNRVFLADGDALILPQTRLIGILEKIRVRLPWVRRISTYGNAKSIRSKTTAQLLALKNLGLDRIYMGLESGHDAVLLNIDKGETAQSMIDAAQKICDTDIFLSVTVLLGIGGADMSAPHAEATGSVLSQMAPRQIAALTVMPLPETPLFRQMQTGEFRLPDAWGIMRELKILVQAISLDRVQFHANHASNYLPIAGRLQRDKGAILDAVDRALHNKTLLTPENMRAL
ncbi:MAG: radical SAM protein [Desulfocapsaceae bacterium]|nr:radical SAM protein [Desulfocapsaceae bacterium]